MARNPKHRKKSGKQTAARKKGKHRKETGIDNAMARFFLGGESKIAGFMHYKPPRWTEEYEKMRVVDLVRRIQDDLEELLARAYPTYTQEWQQRFAPNYWRQFPITYESRLRCVINQSVAEELCRGLWERIISRDKTVSCKACEEYQRLLQQFLEREPRRAANAFAFIAEQAATHLENLFVKRGALMKEIAAKYDLWPINLGLRIKKVKGRPAYQVTRQKFARSYLTELGLNSQCDFPSFHRGGAEPASPFRVVAEELYTKMLLLKRSPQLYVWPPKPTPWAKRLFALTVPITKSNAADWWLVAKVYLYERWGKAQKEFEPLIKHLGFKYPIQFSTKMPSESKFKSRVIDNDLKDAFLALAQPDFGRKLPRVSYKQTS
jgi:hypothetical protein